MITIFQLRKPFWLRIAPQSQFKIQSIQEFYYALSLPKIPKTSLTLFFMSSSLTASYTGSLGTYNKRGSITKLQTEEVAVLLLLVKKKRPSLTSSHRWVGSAQIFYKMHDGWFIWKTILPGEFSWKTDCWDCTLPQLKSRNFKSSKYCHLKHSINFILGIPVIWFGISYHLECVQTPNLKPLEMFSTWNFCGTGGDIKTHKFHFWSDKTI